MSSEIYKYQWMMSGEVTGVFSCIGTNKVTSTHRKKLAESISARKSVYIVENCYKYPSDALYGEIDFPNVKAFREYANEAQNNH